MDSIDLLWRLAILRYLQYHQSTGPGGGPAIVTIQEALTVHEALLKKKYPKIYKKLHDPFK